MDIVVFLVFFSLSIVLHEMGHLLVANLLGQRVRSIHLGFGPQLGQFHLWFLTFIIRFIPLGGYVQINNFNAKWRDTLTLSAGVIINLLAAFVFIVIGSCMMNHQTQIEGIYNGEKTQNITIDNMKVVTWGQLNQYLLYQSMIGDQAVITIQGSQHQSTNHIKEVISHQAFIQLQLLPTLPKQSMSIQKVIHPCLIKKVSPGDEIVSLNHQPVNNMMSLFYLLNKKNQDEMVIGIRNPTEEKLIHFQPGTLDGNNVLGVIFNVIPKTTDSLSVSNAFVYAFNEIVMSLKLQFVVIWSLLTGQISVSDLSGPIGLFQAFQGMTSWYMMGDYLLLLGKINLILGLFNMLPIPPLDGGALILRLLIDGKNAMAIRNLITNIGLIIIIELGIYTTLNDMNFLGPEQDVSPHFVNHCD